MTRKIYKSAMGKTVDLGALLLQNENVRAVGNMNVNAKGDLINSNNQVIDQKNRQVQRMYKKTTNVSDIPLAENSIIAKAMAQKSKDQVQDNTEIQPMPEVAQAPVELQESSTEVEDLPPAITQGGLAAAIARSREIKQELEKTRRQLQTQDKIKKI